MTGWRFLFAVMPLWMLVVFGNSLRRGRTPLIERVARVGMPMLPLMLCAYTRRLTAIWCAYFVGAVLCALMGDHLPIWINGALLFSAVLLFVGEHWLRPKIFPGHVFPGLLQQIRDTRSALRSD